MTNCAVYKHRKAKIIRDYSDPTMPSFEVESVVWRARCEICKEDAWAATFKRPSGTLKKTGRNSATRKSAKDLLHLHMVKHHGGPGKS